MRTKPVQKIERENLNTKVYAALKQMIASNKFDPGARINVEKISRELGVSRTPVWEAVRRLEHEQVVVNSPNKGVFLYTMTPREALELIAVRETLEAMAAQLAAENIDEETLAKLDASMEHQRVIVEAEDLVAYAQADTNFHVLIYGITGNNFLSETLKSIQNKIWPVSIYAAHFIHGFYADHIEIVRALKARDSKKTAECFRLHTQDIMNIIKSGELTFLKPKDARNEGESSYLED